MRAKQQLAGAVSRTEYDTVAQEKTVLLTKLEGANEVLEKTQRELTVYRERAVTSEALNKTLEQPLKEQQEQLRLEFNHVATGILEKISTKFSTQSEEKIGNLLSPLRERLGEFQKTIIDSFTTQGKEQHTLKAEIEKIVLQADSLTKALRGDVKAQGNWGEVMLERILEESGLRPDKDYILQGMEMGLVSADGGRQQPDVIVRLPDNKHIIVDAKVSLVDYERYSSAADDTAKNIHLKNFLKSVRTHVGGLEGKRYQDNDKLGTPDFVLMFMPVEGAYSVAVQQDNELHSYAWSKRIVIVCPATLFATLRTIASIWNIERQNKYADEIAKRGGQLYDQFVAFIADMQGIDDSLKGAQKNYDAALKRLSEGRGVVYQIEKLKALGAKTAKSLPKELLTEDEFDVPKLVVSGRRRLDIYSLSC